MSGNIMALAVEVAGRVYGVRRTDEDIRRVADYVASLPCRGSVEEVARMYLDEEILGVNGYDEDGESW